MAASHQTEELETWSVQLSELSLEVPDEWPAHDAHEMGSQHSLASSEANHGPTPTNHSAIQPRVAQLVAKMEVTRPDILRVTPAFRAFQRCAAALRPEYEGDLFRHSRTSEKIPTFWSHSWHGGQWKKIITLILFYNGRAAMFFSFLAAFLVMPILYGWKVLPGFDRGFFDIQFTTWSLCSGVLVTSLVVLLWRPQAPVFLDRICISQTDPKMKTMAIFSLAGLMKKSDTMLILWDPTWTERLWCLFELAAFLKSRKDGAKGTLIVRPIFIGPVSVSIFLALLAFVIPFTTIPLDSSVEGIGFVAFFVTPLAGSAVLGIIVGYWAVSTIRSYFRDLDLMKEQLLVISFDQARSACCEQQHVSSTGGTVLCDRKIVKECVNIWFGSQEAFEHTVRSQVSDILIRELSENIFTTKWVLSVTSPMIWAFVDLSVSFLLTDSGWSFDDPAFVLEGLSIWLIAIPSIKMVLILLCRLTRRRPQNACLEILKNTAAICLVLLQIMVIIACYVLSRWLRDSGVFTTYAWHAAAGTFVASMVLLSGWWWALAFALKSLLKRPGW